MPNVREYGPGILVLQGASMLIQILDIVRISGVCAAFFFGYLIGFKNGYNPEAQLHIMVPIIIVTIAGISGFEGIFFGDSAAQAKGFEGDRNYQRQSSFAMLSYAATALIVLLCDWGILAELTIFFSFIIFLFLSGINHAADAVRNKNYRWQNINRPFITLLLIAGMAYPVIEALKRIK